MIDPSRVLQPLDDAEDAIRQLRDYHTPAQLASAVRAVWHAVERALRLLLRSDQGAPDALRLAALSPPDLPLDRLIHGLRDRGLVSIELAGLTHQLEQAAGRAAAGDSRAADADVALRAAALLRAEVHSRGEEPVRSAAHHAVEEGPLEEPASPVPPPRRGRGLLVGIAVAVATLVIVFFIVGRLADGTAETMDRAIADFRAGR